MIFCIIRGQFIYLLIFGKFVPPLVGIVFYLLYFFTCPVMNINALYLYYPSNVTFSFDYLSEYTATTWLASFACNYYQLLRTLSANPAIIVLTMACLVPAIPKSQRPNPKPHKCRCISVIGVSSMAVILNTSTCC